MHVKRAAQNQARPNTEVSLVGFRVGEGSFAIEVHIVREILAPTAVVTVPDAARIIIGVIEHRGHVVPIVDLRKRFGFAPLGPSRRAKWIVVEGGSGWLGLAVDEVTEVFRVDATHERPAPKVGPGDASHGFTRVYAFENKLVMALDLQALAKAIQSDTIAGLPALPLGEKEGAQ